MKCTTQPRRFAHSLRNGAVRLRNGHEAWNRQVRSRKATPMAASTTGTARTTRTRKAAAPKVETTEVEASTTPVEVEETTVTEPTTTEPAVEATPEATKPAKQYLVEKAPTTLHEDFAAWILEQTGHTADLKTVQIVCVLRDAYQRSDRSQQMLAARTAKAAEAKTAREAAKIEAAKARLVALQAQLAAAGVTV